MEKAAMKTGKTFACDCGCNLHSSSPSAIKRHMDSEKHRLMLNGGTVEHFNQLRYLRSNVSKFRAGVALGTEVPENWDAIVLAHLEKKFLQER